MKKKFLQYMFLGCSLIVLISSCRKDAFDNTTETGQSGKTFVYLDGAPETDQYFSVFTDVKTVKMLTIRRDAASKTDLNKATTVKLTALPQSYLDDLGYSSIFASDIWTMPTAADIATGGGYVGSEGISIATDGSLTVNFAPGEYAKNLFFKLTGSKFDLSKKYAAAYAISDFGGFTKKTGADTLISLVAIKNAYDGIYTIGGTITRYQNGISDPDTELGGDYPTDSPLESEVGTLSPYSNSFQLFWKTGGGISGVDGLQFAVDPNTNLVTVTAPGSPGSILANTPGGDNYYDPATKTFHLAFTWGATNKRIANITLTYSKSR